MIPTVFCLKQEWFNLGRTLGRKPYLIGHFEVEGDTMRNLNGFVSGDVVLSREMLSYNWAFKRDLGTAIALPGEKNNNL